MLTRFIHLHFELSKFNSGPIDKTTNHVKLFENLINIQFQFKTNVHFIMVKYLKTLNTQPCGRRNKKNWQLTLPNHCREQNVVQARHFGYV